MGMQVNTNIAANNAYRNLATTQNDLSKSLEKLSSGLRINRAADDAAGLAISEGLKSQVGGLTVASRNAQDAISVIQTAEGSLNEATSILQRMRDLAVQAGNDSNSDESRAAITTEVAKLTEELGRIGESTNFNGQTLLNGPNSLSFQIGANSGDAIEVDLTEANVATIASTLENGALTGAGFDMAVTDGDLSGITATTAGFTSTTAGGVVTTVQVTGLTASPTNLDTYADELRADEDFAANFTVGVTRGANGQGASLVVKANDGGTVTTVDTTGTTAAVTGFNTITGSTGSATGLRFETAELAQQSIVMLDDQITKISGARAELGADQNRFESVIKNIAVSKENLTAAGSRIRDTDMAEEMVKYTRANILSQAGTAMLAQANQSNSGVLQLLG